MPDPSSSFGASLPCKMRSVAARSLAYAAGKNGRARFSRGNWRDLVVLAQDPFKADPSELLKIRLPPQPALVARQNKKSSMVSVGLSSGPDRSCRTGWQWSKAVPSRAILTFSEEKTLPCHAR
jgi:hypothetical protein